MAADPVSFFIPDHPHTSRKLVQLLHAEREKWRIDVANGAASDYADYRYRVGVICGFEIAIRLCQQIEQEMH